VILDNFICGSEVIRGSEGIFSSKAICDFKENCDKAICDPERFVILN